LDIKKQKLLTEYLISSTDTFALCASIVHPDYFDPELRNAISFIKKYYDEYNSTPTEAQIEGETGIELKQQVITKDQVSYCANEIEAFCKRKAIEKAVLASPALIDKGDYGKVEELIKDAVTVSLNRDLGLLYSDDPEERLRRLANTEQTTPTDWTEVDELLNGGLVRKQMLLFSANSGGGKSIAMANLGLNFLAKGLNVLYISLELSEEMVSLRYDSMVTGVASAGWQYKISEIAAKVESAVQGMGELTVKYMNAGSNANDIRAYLKEFELTYGYTPDAIIVDYLDLMGTNEFISSENVFEKDKAAAEQLRNIANDYNAFMITAAQQNRAAVGQTDINHSHIAGGISKINTTDVYISIIMNDAMRANGEIAFMFLKTRSSDGVGKTIYLKWNPVSLRITDPDGGGGHNTPLNLKDQRAKNGSEDFLSEPSGKGLLDLIQV
jgi:KaiC/GvpD/RAD55 family RecA-like ATPase